MQERSPLLVTGSTRNNSVKLTVGLISIIFFLGAILLLNLVSEAHQLVLVQNHVVVRNGLAHNFVYQQPKVPIIAIYSSKLCLTMISLVSAGNLFLCEIFVTFFKRTRNQREKTTVTGRNFCAAFDKNQAFIR